MMKAAEPRSKGMLFGRWRAALITGCRLHAGRGRRIFHRDEGSDIVEMALVSSVLFAMLFGVIEVSLALYTFNYVSDAAREATRYASVRGSSCNLLTNCNATAAQIQTYVQNLGYPGMKPANTTVTSTWLSPSAAPVTWSTCGGTCNAPGDAVQVTVTYSFPLGLPFVSKSVLSLHSTSMMVIAN